MAGSKLKYASRVSGSTILEVVISMVIILVVFGMAMMMYANVTRSSLSVKKIKAQAILHQILANDERNKENSSQVFTVDDFRIEQKVSTYEGNNALTEIDIIAFDANLDTVARLQKIIKNTNE